MKEIGRIKSIIITVVLAVVFVAGIVLSFVPMAIGKYDYESFFGALNLSKDLNEVATAEYTIKGEFTDSQLKSSMEIMTKLLSHYGVDDISICQKGNDKLLVEINDCVVKTDRADLNTVLGYLASGKLEFKNKNSATATLEPDEDGNVDETLIIIDGAKHIKSIEKINYQSQYGVKVEFTSEGKRLYEEATGGSLYMFVNGKAWPNTNYNQININNASTTMFLTVGTSEQADYYYYTMSAGMMEVQLDSESLDITYLKGSTDGVSSVYNTAKIILFIVAGVIYLGAFVFLTIKFKAFGVTSLISSTIMTAFLIFLAQAMGWVVVGQATIYAFIVLTLINMFVNYIIFDSISKEYKIGKSLTTATTDGFKKSLETIVDICVIVFILGFVVAITTTQELRSVGTIVALGSAFILFSALLFNRLILNLIYSLFSKPETLFGFVAHKEDND